MNSRLVQNIIAMLVLLIVSGLCFQVLVSNPTGVLVGTQNLGYNDTTNFFIASKSYQKECIEKFDQFPFWNPYSLLGMPWLGNPQASLYYPLNWIFFFLNATTTISWMMVLHHWWAGLGAYLLGKKYQLNFFSSLLCGIIFLSGPYFVAKTGEGHFTSITQIAWFPWILYGYELLREGSKKAVPVLAILISLAFFCGHVQELYFLLLLLTASIVIESLISVISQKKQSQQAKTALDPIQSNQQFSLPSAKIWLKGWILAGLLTVGLVAIDLIPMFVYTTQAVRTGGIELNWLRDNSLTFSSLLQLVDPFIWGGPENYTGPGIYYWEAVCSFGCLPLLLAILGIFTSFRKRIVIRLTLIGLVALLLAFGPQLPLYTLFYELIPGVSMFRLPTRMLWICSLTVAMLAGFGSEFLYSLFLNTNRKTYRLVMGICFAVSSLLLGYLIFNSDGYLTLNGKSNQIIRIQLGYFMLAILGISTAVFLTSFSRKAAIGGSLILCAICTWELSAYSHQILTTIPQDSIRSDTKIITFLNENLGEHRVLVDQKLLSDREAWKHQILKIQGYEPVPLVRLGVLASAAFPQGNTATVMAGYDPPQLNTARSSVLDLMSVKYAILQTNQPLQLEGWQPILQGTIPEEFTLRNLKPRQIPFFILENKNPLPRAFIVGNTHPLNHDEPSEQIVSAISKMNPQNVVLLQQDILPQGKRQSFKAATILKDSPNKLTIEAKLDAPGYLVVTDIFYTGWTAKIQNQELPILPADFSLRAIPLPEGEHQIQLSYIPPGFKIGRVISITTLAIILVLLLTPFRTTPKQKID